MLYNKKIFKRCFDYKGRYWYKNLKYIPLYFKLIHYLVKHGYDEYATWDISNWFTYTMKSILKDYNKYRMGTPIIIGDFNDENNPPNSDENEKEWNRIVNRMIELLELIEKYNSEYYEIENWKEIDIKRDEAKDEFFKLFSKHFYNLWD